MATDCTSTRTSLASTSSEGAQKAVTDLEPQAGNHGAGAVATGFLFCLSCGTPMIGYAECPGCSFPRKTRPPGKYLQRAILRDGDKT